MRFQFKTSYNQDIRLFRDKVDALLVRACSRSPCSPCPC